MKNFVAIFSLLTVASAGQVLAADPAQIRQEIQTQAQTKSQIQVRDQERIYGSQLMTRQERLQYHNQMRALKTEQEREAFRKQHHEKMQARAKARGLSLPDEPPVPGAGKGMGPGMGQGGRR